MIIKVQVFTDQLARLHEALESKENFTRDRLGPHGKDEPYVLLRRSVGHENYGQEPGKSAAVYDVTLEVKEKPLHGPLNSITPLSKLVNVLHALGLFREQGAYPSGE